MDPGLVAGLSPSARILDYGCGYGRTMVELASHGFTDVSGVDLSPALIARGREQSPRLGFDVLTDPPAVARDAGSCDLVLLELLRTRDLGPRTLATALAAARYADSTPNSPSPASTCSPSPGDAAGPEGAEYLLLGPVTESLPFGGCRPPVGN